ncbi:Glu/Leu/Phe/Val dehydrogenase [Aestuariicella hydrocarbonica]|uniref:Glu/Leu/Phe/Val dehydrogenase n=1 Tax=Pseudomaricurvus hydrocarbonicus TaxID=1470433 RepID=A0A9E5MNU9_9GAMM|nr:Glu/Leu/Phe/Val dehydrogenase [Aestuariicella hydrocarbonica]NHO67587.1 Glu/Leu/Phe/Val dehydrogenase [Aestuariicella hydrocarbonica]
MSVFEHRSYDDHQRVAFCQDKKTGLKAIIAIHNTNLGNALGGCRMFPYASGEAALDDVLRLSRGMTYKSAAANLPLGGGKSVILGDPRQHKTEDLLRAMGRFIDSFNGDYVAAEDSGINESDMRIMALETSHVAGFSSLQGDRGDPSPATAYGVFVGLQLAVQQRFKTSDLKGVRVAIQGVGNVGYRLAEMLHQAGAQLWVSDVFAANAQRAEKELSARVVDPSDIFTQDVDVIAPCALGATIDDTVLNLLRAQVIAGSANNQLAYDDLGAALCARGILYAPDYVINAGGIIDVYYQRQGLPYAKAHKHITQCITDTLKEVFQRSAATGEPTNLIADQVARNRFDPQSSAMGCVA